MKSLKDIIENIAAEAADGKVTLTVALPDSARGSYVVTSAASESWSHGTLYRVRIESVIPMDGGAMTTANVWIQIGGGEHISKIVVGSKSSDGRNLSSQLAGERNLRGCMLRVGDHVVAASGYMNMHHMKNLIIEA